MTKKKKVMVVGHDASLSGAPILLLNLFQLLIKRGVVDVQFVVRRGGPLVMEYKKVAPLIVLKSVKYDKEKGMFLHTAHFLQNKIRLLLVLIKAVSCDYLFFNTVVNGKLMRWFRFHKKPVITYVHELEKVIDLYIQQNDAVLPLTISNAIVCPSMVTESLLANKYNISHSKMMMLPYYFPFTEKEYDSNKALKTCALFRQRFGFKENDFIVGAVGTVTERKGVDLFIDTCEKVVRVNPSIKFVWCGAFESRECEAQLKDVIKTKRLDSNLIFTGPLEYDIYNFSAFNIFFLSSREDTYPLVVLEAAIMKVPAICFSGSGGIVEFIGTDSGWMIDDFSTSLAAHKIIELQNMKDVVRLRGETAFNKVVRLHCDENAIIDQYISVVNRLKND